MCDVGRSNGVGPCPSWFTSGRPGGAISYSERWYVTLKNLLRQRYSGTFFDSSLLKVAAPAVNKLDQIEQRRKGIPETPEIPPFSLRARSNGSWQQFGGERFIEAGDRLIDFLSTRSLLASDAEVVEIGCGVGRYALALKRSGKQYRYTGVDIDASSINWCKSNLADASHSFHLLDVSNGAYNQAGDLDPTSVSFSTFADGTASLVFLWSVFTHMELDHIRHYLSVMRPMLRDGGTIVFSAFIYDDRESIRTANPHAYRSGFVANLERPMKQIAFPMTEFERAISDAGLKMANPPILRAESPDQMWPIGAGLGQDVFVLEVA